LNYSTGTSAIGETANQSDKVMDMIAIDA